ncbi:MAG: YhbY family RNA-binding protein [Gammaproteobacteria bacterium]|nr:YhbY family RNA-binding protein [Gammaproteobacteria bacterium]
MSKPSSTDIKALKKQSHHLEPVILMGAKGLTDSVQKEIELALYSHELVKIKLSSKDKAEKQALTDAICKKNAATLIAQIGHTITIYKKSPKEKAVIPPSGRRT